MQKIKEFQISIVVVFLGSLFTFYLTGESDKDKHQQEINEKLLVNSATATAYAANSEARINQLQTDFKEHLAQFLIYQKEDQLWKGETREWYIELRAKQARDKRL